MRKLIPLLLIAVMLLCAACTGPDGPMGPEGDQGEIGTSGQDGTDGTDGQDGTDGTNGTNGQDGQDGTDGVDGQDGEDGAGTRVVYNSASPATSNLVYYLIPEITLADMPLVTVYSAFSIAPNTWYELPQYLESIGGDGMMCWFEEGKVTIENCIGSWIKIVVVT